MLIPVPTSALSKVLSRAKLFSKQQFLVLLKLNHKHLKIRILSIVNNNLAPLIVQGHIPQKISHDTKFEEITVSLILRRIENKSFGQFFLFLKVNVFQLFTHCPFSSLILSLSFLPGPYEAFCMQMCVHASVLLGTVPTGHPT